MTDPGTEVVAVADSLSGTDLERVGRLGMWLAAAESGSKDPKALGAAAALRIAYAEHLGLPPHAAQDIYIIKGNLSLSSKMCRALAHQHGLRVERHDETADSCTAVLVDEKTGNEIGRTTYTLAQAAKAGLSGTNWSNAPDRMLWARASKRVLDDFAPWVTVGVATVEEIGDAEVVDSVLEREDAVPFEDAD
jgi:hypothetical protein